MQKDNASAFPLFRKNNLVIEVGLLTVGDLETEVGEKVAKAYQQVFAEHPWYEQSRCVGCVESGGQDRQFPFYSADSDTPQLIRPVPSDQRCDLCHSQLQQYWPIERVLKDFHDDFVEYSFTFVFAKEQSTGEIIGFASGFTTTTIKLENHLKLNGLSERLSDKEPIAYLSDLGVVSQFRQKGVARHLKEVRQELILRQNPRSIVFRTRPNSVTYKWYTREDGFKVVDSYSRIDSNDPRVVLLKQNEKE